MSRTSTGMCGTAWAPSIITSMPRACASSVIRLAGWIPPVTLETCVIETKRTRPVSISSNRATSRSPFGRIGAARSFAPVCLHRSNQGMMLEFADEHLVPGPDAGVLDDPGNQVQRLRGPAAEDDFLCIRGVDKLGGLCPDALEAAGRLVAQRVPFLGASILLRIDLPH